MGEIAAPLTDNSTTFNDWFRTEAEARFGWGLYCLLRWPDKPEPPFLV